MIVRAVLIMLSVWSHRGFSIKQWGTSNVKRALAAETGLDLRCSQEQAITDMMIVQYEGIHRIRVKCADVANNRAAGHAKTSFESYNSSYDSITCPDNAYLSGIMYQPERGPFGLETLTFVCSQSGYLKRVLGGDYIKVRGEVNLNYGGVVKTGYPNKAIADNRLIVRAMNEFPFVVFELVPFFLQNNQRHQVENISPTKSSPTEQNVNPEATALQESRKATTIIRARRKVFEYDRREVDYQRQRYAVIFHMEPRHLEDVKILSRKECMILTSQSVDPRIVKRLKNYFMESYIGRYAPTKKVTSYNMNEKEQQYYIVRKRGAKERYKKVRVKRRRQQSNHNKNKTSGKIKGKKGSKNGGKSNKNKPFATGPPITIRPQTKEQINANNKLENAIKIIEGSSIGDNNGSISTGTIDGSELTIKGDKINSIIVPKSFASLGSRDEIITVLGMDGPVLQRSLYERINMKKVLAKMFKLGEEDIKELKIMSPREVQVITSKDIAEEMKNYAFLNEIRYTSVTRHRGTVNSMTLVPYINHKRSTVLMAEDVFEVSDFESRHLLRFLAKELKISQVYITSVKVTSPTEAEISFQHKEIKNVFEEELKARIGDHDFNYVSLSGKPSQFKQIMRL